MTALHSLSRRLRLLALLAILVAFDVVAVAAAYVLAHVAAGVAPIAINQYEHLFWALSFDIVPLWPVLLVGTPLVLVCQSIFGYRLSLREAHGHDGTLATVDGMHTERHERVRRRVERLAHIANMASPSVTVVDSDTPNSYVISRPGEKTLVATTALLEKLNHDELDAVLAHELAHLKNGDAFVMTAAAFLPTVSRRFLAALSRPLRRSWLGQRLLGSTDDAETDDGWNWGYGQAAVAVFLFTLVAIPITAVLYLTSTACYRLLSRIREYSADAGAVAICGSPASLASALEQLTGNARPDADIRTADVGVRELCVVPHAISEADSGQQTAPADRLAHRLDTVTERLLPGSHPDPTDRIGALQQHESQSTPRRDF